MRSACPSQLETIIVVAVADRVLSVRLDHRGGGVLKFGEQLLESDALRHQLSLLASQLLKVRWSHGALHACPVGRLKDFWLQTRRQT
jgi:hypothetical protein